ncbi:MAG: T9SS type A sorting domain-containing protein [Chitinophagales bacterium]
MVQRNVMRIGMLIVLLFAMAQMNAQIQAGTDYIEVQTNGCQTNIDVLANDNYSGTIQLNLVDTPQNGIASVQGNVFTYCANAGYVGADRFSYRISGSGSTAVANVFVNILAANASYFSGDADNNGRVENHDILAIGLSYGATGSQHLFPDSGASLAWDPLPYINSDPGACDGDRNSLVNYLDAGLIDLRYGQNNPFRTFQPKVMSDQVPQGLPIELVLAGDTNIADGDTMQLTLRLKPGSQNNSFYGLSYVISMDTSCMSPFIASSQPTGNWRYNSPDSVINFYKPAGQYAFHGAVVRTNHQNWNGGGDILTIKIPVIDNIDGIKRPPGSYPIVARLSDVRVINAYDVVLPIQTLSATRANLQIYTTGEKEIPNVIVSIYPNPTRNLLQISSNTSLKQLKITDALGRIVYIEQVSNGLTNASLTLPNVAPGSYSVSIETKYGFINKSLLIIP